MDAVRSPQTGSSDHMASVCNCNKQKTTQGAADPELLSSATQAATKAVVCMQIKDMQAALEKLHQQGAAEARAADERLQRQVAEAAASLTKHQQEAAEQLAKADAEHQKLIADSSQLHQQQLQKLREEAAAAMIRTQQQHEADASAAKSEAQQERAKAEQSLDEKAAAMHNLQKQIEQLEMENAGLEAAKNELQQNLEAAQSVGAFRSPFRGRGITACLLSEA